MHVCGMPVLAALSLCLCYDYCCCCCSGWDSRVGNSVSRSLISCFFSRASHGTASTQQMDTADSLRKSRSLYQHAKNMSWPKKTAGERSAWLTANQAISPCPPASPRQIRGRKSFVQQHSGLRIQRSGRSIAPSSPLSNVRPSVAWPLQSSHQERRPFLWPTATAETMDTSVRDGRSGRGGRHGANGGGAPAAVDR